MSSSGNHTILLGHLAVCSGCLQYREDCHCCLECGGIDVHAPICSVEGPVTKRSSVAELRPPSSPMRVIVKVDEDAGETETTARVLVTGPTLRSRR